MSKKGPPKFFDQKPQGPSKVPLPAVRTGRGRSRQSGNEESAPQKKWVTAPAKSGGGRSLFGGGESWKTYAVIGVSAVLLVVIIIGYVTKGYKELDRSRGVQEMALVGAALQAIDSGPGGLRLAQSVRNDTALLKIASDIVEGGQVTRNEAGEIAGSTPPGKGAARLFVPSIPERPVNGGTFHFVFPIGEERRLPSIVVEGIGTLHPPNAEGRWVFDGDLSGIQREREVGGEIAFVQIKRPGGSATTVEVFKPKPAGS